MTVRVGRWQSALQGRYQLGQVTGWVAIETGSSQGR